jgi:hypothetical protein
MKKKTAEFQAAATLKDNQIEVTASTEGTLLRDGYVFAPGAWTKNAQRSFSKDGAILVGHDWDDLPIGFPVSSRMEGSDLVSVAQFHTDEVAQRARTIAKERMDAGLNVSVSVGFMPNYQTCSYFSNGADLLAAAEGEGMDMSRFDTKAIKAHKYGIEFCREVAEWFEWSIVLVGRNQLAKARQVHDFSGESAHGLTLREHLEFSLGGIERAFAIERERQAKGRHISQEHRPTIAQIHLVTSQMLESFAQDDEPALDPQTDSALEELRQRALMHRAAASLMR